MTSTKNSTNGVKSGEGVDWDVIDEMAETAKNALIVITIFGIGFIVEYILYRWITRGR